MASFTLQDFLTDTADLLHDPLNRIWSQTQLIRYINEARRKVVYDTGCARGNGIITLLPGRERYDFGSVTGYTITNGGSGYSTPPAVSFSGGGGTISAAATAVLTNGSVSSLNFSNFGNGYEFSPTVSFSGGGGANAGAFVTTLSIQTYDILGLYLIWGAERYALLWKPWSDLSAKIRVWLSQNYMRQPVAWSAFGDRAFYIGPPPDQPYQLEMDTMDMVEDLVNTTDIEPGVVLKYQDLVKYYAAYRAKYNNYDYGEAGVLLKTYKDLLNEMGSGYMRRIPNPYEV